MKKRRSLLRIVLPALAGLVLCTSLQAQRALQKNPNTGALIEGFKSGANTIELSATGTLLFNSGFTLTGASHLKTALSLNNVENTALSTWAGTSNLTTLGTVTTGTWQGSIIAPVYLGTGSSISTKFLRGDGTWQTVSGGGGSGDALTTNPLSQFAATTSAQLRGVLTDESGTGEFLTTNGSAASLTSFPTLNQNTTGTAAGLSTTLAISSGGTGSTTASDARTALGLAIGTNVQAYDADLTTYAGITPSANVQSLLGAADYAAMRTQLDLEPYVDYMPYTLSMAALHTIAGEPPNTLPVTDGLGGYGALATGATGYDLIQAASASAARSTLGVVIGTNVQAYDADLTTYAGITPSANVQSLLGAANYAAMKTLLSLSNVENTALSTWAGTSNLTTLGTITTGVWSGTALVGTKVDAATTTTRGTVELATDGETSASVAVQGNDARLANANRVEIGLAISDETSDNAASSTTPKITFRMPHAMTLTGVRCSLTKAASGALFIVDIHESGTTIMSTNKLSVDASETTSTTAATAPGITDSSLADDAVIEVFIDQVGTTTDNTGEGVKVWLIGTR